MLNLFRRDFKECEAQSGDDRLKRKQNCGLLKIIIRHRVDEGDLPLDWAHQEVTLGKANPLWRTADIKDVSLGATKCANGEAEVFNKYPHYRQTKQLPWPKDWGVTFETAE